MAKDTEKLIRQLSLISYLMAERRPVTATEIRRDVEGYSDMTEDAFARRFYADRAELESLGIQLSVDRPADGFSEQENYSLAREAFHLPAIAFTDQELASLQTALSLLDGEFAYAEPLRLALQQITWGRPSPLSLPHQRTVGLGITAAAGGHEVSQRLAKIDTAIYRRKRIEFEYFTMATGETALRRVDPYQLTFEGGQFYLVGYSHERDAIRVFRLDRIKGKVAYATKAEHDFQRPDFDPREYANRVPWQLGDPVGTAEIWVSERIAWMVERHFSAYGELTAADGGSVFRSPYAIPRLIIAWALGFGGHARILGPAELRDEARERLERIVAQHRGDAPELVDDAARARAQAHDAQAEGEAEPRPRSRPEAAIRPERFARLVTLASVLIRAGREGRRLRVAEVRETLQMSEQELREDINVLNVVNFGGGTYVLYAEVLPSGEIEVDTEPYSDTFDRPARLLPIEAKALVAAIDLLGEHLPAGSLASARKKIVDALGEDPVREGLQVTTAGGDDSQIARVVASAIEDRRVLEIEYYVESEDRLPVRRIEPYALINGREGWYVSAWDPAKDGMRHFRLDRIKRAAITGDVYEPREDLDPIADIEGWPRTGEVEGSRVAHVWVAPEQARWAREERTVIAELDDGAIVVEWAFKGEGYLVKEVLREAGDAAVLEPADVRARVLEAAERLLDAAAPAAAAVS
ncbi:MAG TPA: WYL domain-containing protein [Solirubrobacteraceae bacterium]|nr:WYL domain-containing protein [Solirubrobacteraceae bacterium]